jgi:hypothetical protein
LQVVEEAAMVLLMVHLVAAVVEQAVYAQL